MEEGDRSTLRVGTWNTAAINNNPFEFWITHEDAEYNRMMQNVQAFLDTPGSADVAVSTILTEPMLASLRDLMLKEGWDQVNEAVSEWHSQYAARSIIDGFMKDGTLGKKRLMSMPDRMTNTINLADDNTAYRPTVINCFPERFGSIAEFWTKWTDFMFSKELQLASGKSTKPSGLVGKISRAKYPALSEAEEAMSRPLSMICQAAFDLILVHMLDTINGGAHKVTWQPLRLEMCEALNSRKNQRTYSILNRSYRDSDAFFLQEISSAFAKSLKTRQRIFEVFVAPNDGKRDQISVILLNKSRFDTSTMEDRTALFNTELAASGDKAPVAPGDLIALSVRERATKELYLFASFHGDTDGLATVPVVKAMAKVAQSVFGTPLPAGHKFVFGMDANTYVTGSKRRQGVLEFASEYSQLGLSSVWGDTPDPHNITTFNARTYLQPQLNKATAFKDLQDPATGDKNPKDFILFPKSSFKVLSTTKDNTGKKTYIEKQPFPTLTFPSDHGILSSVLKIGA